jgi:hypothetical protein
LKLKAAGILNILSGVLLVIGVAYFSRMMYNAAFSPTSSNRMPESMAWALILVMCIPGTIVGMLNLVGGIYALRGKLWGLAFAGSILSLVIPPLGLSSGILLVLARKGWSKATRGVIIGILSFLAFIVVCFYVLAQFL